MLATAQELCRHVLPWQVGYPIVPFDIGTGSFDPTHSALISTNGDAELWQTLCSIDNDPPIRALAAKDWTASNVQFSISTYDNLYRPSGYPANTPVGDQHGRIATSLLPDNTMPWCILKPTDATMLALAQQYVVSNAVNGAPLPLCPDTLSSGNYQLHQDPPGTGSNDELENWATRGAINAGLAVFLYLDQVVVHGLQPVPAYDHCEQLNQ